MGLSASQGRMLLLTARRSDLEFRAQQISQKRLILSQQLEEIATDYEEASSDRQLTMTLYLNGSTEYTDPNCRTTQNLTYAALTSGMSSMGGFACLNTSATSGEYTSSAAFRLKDADGYIIVASESEIPAGMKKQADGTYSGTLNHTWKQDYTETTGEGEDAKTETKQRDRTSTEVVKYKIDPNLKTSVGSQNDANTAPNYLQDCLRNGKYIIQQGIVGDVNGLKAAVWSDTSWETIASIKDSTYDDNDAVAKAKYDRLQSQIQNQDKKLELELDNIETQRSAITTEVESVQKVIDDNIESTFKSFA